MKKFLSDFYKRLNIGNFNQIEKIYLILYVLSIVSGTVYGIINANYFKPYQEAGKLDVQENENNYQLGTKVVKISDKVPERNACDELDGVVSRTSIRCRMIELLEQYSSYPLHKA